MSLILEDTREKTNLQKGDRVVVEFFDGFFTIACGRDGRRLLITPNKDTRWTDTRWTACGDKRNMRDIMMILSDVNDFVFKKVAETKNAVAFTIL